MSDWAIDKKNRTATIELFGGTLLVFLNARDGSPEALWRREDAPAETRAFRIQAASQALQDGEESNAGEERIADLRARVLAAGRLPDPVRAEGLLEVTAYVHFMPLVEAMNAAPGVIRSSLRQTHPELFAAIVGEAQPAAVGKAPF